MKLLMRSLLGLLLIAGTYSCQKEISLESGSTAAFMLQDVFGDCLGDTVAGTYYAGKTLGDTNYLDIKVYALSTGRYSMNTDVQNGFSFRGSGNFTDTGLVTVRLMGVGTPADAMVTNLRIARDSGYCDIVVNVLPNPGGGSGGGSCNAQVAGNYQKDTVLNTTHTVTVQHTFASTGTFTVYTDTVNGYWFRKDVTVTAAGQPQTIVLQGGGTPAATGGNTFNVRFGDTTTCSFSVTVTGTGTQPGSTDYFPLAPNSWWSYNDPNSTGAGDTLLTTNSGSSTIGGNTYRLFTQTDAFGSDPDSFYYRKDAAGATYELVPGYMLGSLFGAGVAPGVNVEVPIVKDNATAGTSWLSPTVTTTQAGINITFRLNMQCTSNSATLTLNGHTFSNVIVMKSIIEFSSNGSPFTPLPQFSEMRTQWFAPGVGLIQEAVTDFTGTATTSIRYWKIM